MTNCSDGTVSVYSLDNTTPIMNYTSPGTSVAAFDYDGLIIGKYNGSGSTSKTFSLYDLNKPQSVLFNPNGRLAILGTNFKRLICINTVNGSAIFACCYGDIPASKSSESDICYPAISPDGKYLISDKSLKVWNFKGQLVSTLKGHEGKLKGYKRNIGPPAFVAFNPRKAMISSACIKVAWWIPNMKTETQE
uniref:WD domain, G-beta repeat n=1 Tax=Theileria annulata TaxID=5874 RepID=A0A3B0MRZ1_THEAN